MTRDALANESRLIGMIQPTESETTEPDNQPPLYKTGCAGRIVSFSETDDGRYVITLAGLIRFDMVEEVATTRGYRRAVASWSSYARDLQDDESVIDRKRLVTALRDYFKMNSLKADWKSIDGAPDEQLITTLAMVCPFGPSEKQALLECPDLAHRTDVLLTLIEMSLAQGGGEQQPRH
jgi:Lon protease-like protein